MTCPGCGRLVAVRKPLCVYCGAALPEQAQAGASGGELSPEVDALMRKALSGQLSPTQLRAAMTQAITQAPPPPPAPARPAAPAARPSEATPPPPARAPAQAPRAPSAAPDAPSSPAASWTLQMVRAAEAAHQALRSEDGLAFERALGQTRAALEVLEGLLRGQAPPPLPSPLGQTQATPARPPAPPPPTPVAAQPPPLPAPAPRAPAGEEPQGTTLPPLRQPFILVLPALGDEALGPALAAALKTDLATARLFARSSFTRASLRGSDGGALEEIAAEIRRSLGRYASVIRREDVVAAPQAQVVLSAAGPVWTVGTLPLWLAGVEGGPTPPSATVQVSRIELAVPGEVEIKRFRAGAPNPRLTRQPAGELVEVGSERVHVLDLYGPGVAARLVAGITQFQGFPGADPRSASVSLRQFIERLPGLYPGLVTEGKRVVTPGEGRPTPTEDGTPSAILTAWPAWEEHTRLCLLRHRASRA